jgi:hypothetical protein
MRRGPLAGGPAAQRTRSGGRGPQRRLAGFFARRSLTLAGVRLPPGLVQTSEPECPRQLELSGPARPRGGSQPALGARGQATPQASAGLRATARARARTSSRDRHHQPDPLYEGAAANEGESRQHGDQRPRAHASHTDVGVGRQRRSTRFLQRPGLRRLRPGDRALRHSGQPLRVVEPTVHGADDVFPGRDPVREKRPQERIAIRCADGASASGR